MSVWDGRLAQLHASPTRLVIAVTGGGSRAISDLLAVPGASATVLEAVVPYAGGALARFLGGRPEQFCSAPTARAMAMAAWQRAWTLEQAPATPDGRNLGNLNRGSRESDSRNSDGQAPGPPATDPRHLLGAACTASLASTRPKRGAHRAYIALQSAQWTESTALELTKGARNRQQEERLVADVLLWRLLQAAGVPCEPPEQLLAAEVPQVQRTEPPAAWTDLLLGRIAATASRPGYDPGSSRPVSSSSRLDAAPPRGSDARRVIFPGAFHPRHLGHRQMAELASDLLGAPVEHELSIENVDKPWLDFTELAERAAQFSPDETLWLTRAPTFRAKAELFPGATFLVGADTILRVAEPRYYGSRQAMLEAVARISELGCRFLVFGRLADGTFRTLSELRLPAELLALCTEVPGQRFRADISSTQLRLSAGESG
ncbi:MAG: hypothetical protein J5I93_21345 [Pirellulaceae bacterium]|nr:hypothetical protein [Pirellulaceae bacterium]